jgi:hypothetical protein
MFTATRFPTTFGDPTPKLPSWIGCGTILWGSLLLFLALAWRWFTAARHGILARVKTLASKSLTHFVTERQVDC